MSTHSLRSKHARSAHSSPGAGWARIVGALVGGILIGAWGRGALRADAAPIADPARVSAASRAPKSIQTVSSRRAALRAKPFLVRPVELCEDHDQERERAYRKEQSNSLVDLMFARLAAVENTHKGETPEALINQVVLYQKGLIDGVARMAPELSDELSARIEADLCKPGTRDAQLMLHARTLQEMPELASEAAFNCIFEKREKEDIVLWTMLDAWRDSELPETPALTDLSRRFRDPRTRARFLSRDPMPAPAAPAEAPPSAEMQQVPGPG